MAKIIKFITVERDIHINDSSTGEIVKKFRQLIDSGEIDINKAILCRIEYILISNYIEDGPVKIYFLDGTRVRLNLTAGYGGTGPLDTCKILKLCGFDFDTNDILSHQEMVNVKYYKDIDEEYVYQFKTPEGTFEYSGM